MPDTPPRTSRNMFDDLDGESLRVETQAQEALGKWARMSKSLLEKGIDPEEDSSVQDLIGLFEGITTGSGSEEWRQVEGD